MTAGLYMTVPELDVPEGMGTNSGRYLHEFQQGPSCTRSMNSSKYVPVPGVYITAGSHLSVPELEVSEGIGRNFSRYLHILFSRNRNSSKDLPVPGV
jgi:hypothetical protein